MDRPIHQRPARGLDQGRPRQLALPGLQNGRDQPAAGHRARHLHRQGEPHLRPGAGRHEGRQWRRLAGAVRRKRHAQPPQAGARVRAARQLLREFGRERRRAQLVHRGHCAGLCGEAVAQRVRPPAPPLRFRRAGPGFAAARRLPVDQRRRRRHFHTQFRLHGGQQAGCR